MDDFFLHPSMVKELVDRLVELQAEAQTVNYQIAAIRADRKDLNVHQLRDEMLKAQKSFYDNLREGYDLDVRNQPSMGWIRSELNWIQAALKDLNQTLDDLSDEDGGVRILPP